MCRKQRKTWILKRRCIAVGQVGSPQLSPWAQIEVTNKPDLLEVSLWASRWFCVLEAGVGLDRPTHAPSSPMFPSNRALLQQQRARLRLRHSVGKPRRPHPPVHSSPSLASGSSPRCFVSLWDNVNIGLRDSFWHTKSWNAFGKRC